MPWRAAIAAAMATAMRLPPRFGDCRFDEENEPSRFMGVAATLAGLVTPIELARRAARRVAPAVTVDGLGEDFSGNWRLAESVNFDEYLKSLNVSSTQRSFAVRASVEHKIRRRPDGDAARYEVCVVTRLGTKCETFTVGAEPILSSDARGDPIVKSIQWETDDKDVLVTSVESTSGRLVDKRRLSGPDEMVMELISPSQVCAYRVFRRSRGSS